ncbi:MAG: ATP-binding cassette domain-containing protein [Lachnospiraceae bacterium]|nr:ATP-binding cassette domain-containing protein [Lachnospiraceae bacterium]
MYSEDKIIIRGLRQNNLKNVPLDIPKGKIVVFTGVSGSGKSSIVFDTIAAESQRQMNKTYTAFIRGRLPKYEKPRVERIDNLSAPVIVDQSRLGVNARSTVGTISDMYAALRLLYSRIREPYVGTASYFSFNDPNGMCKTCSGIGKILDLDIERAIDPDKSWNESMLNLPAFKVGNYYWKQYVGSGLFDLDKKYRDYTPEERNLLLFGSREPGGPRVHKRVEGIKTQFQRLCLMKGPEEQNDHTLKKLNQFMEEKVCPDCGGKRLNPRTLACKVAGYSIHEMCAMEFTELVEVLRTITDSRAASIVEALTASLQRMIDIGLPYLSMDRESSTLSGGEAQRLKLASDLDKQGNIYVLDEPTTGLHASDVKKIMELLDSLVDRGNTVIVIEHNTDVMKQADWIIDVSPDGGTAGGEIVFTGTPKEMAEQAQTITAEYLRKSI